MSPLSTEASHSLWDSKRAFQRFDHDPFHTQEKEPQVSHFPPKRQLRGCSLHGLGRREAERYQKLSVGPCRWRVFGSRHSKWRLSGLGFWRGGWAGGRSWCGALRGWAGRCRLAGGRIEACLDGGWPRQWVIAAELQWRMKRQQGRASCSFSQSWVLACTEHSVLEILLWFETLGRKKGTGKERKVWEEVLLWRWEEEKKLHQSRKKRDQMMNIQMFTCWFNNVKTKEEGWDGI